MQQARDEFHVLAKPVSTVWLCHRLGRFRFGRSREVTIIACLGYDSSGHGSPAALAGGCKFSHRR